MKILFTSVGRRVELVQAFRAAANRLGEPLTIVGADMQPTAPALYFCDQTELVCRIKDPAYIPTLLSVCEREKIDCLIPTIDTDLNILSTTREQFEKIGTKVLISDPEKVFLCRDKTKTSDYFTSLGLKAPVSFASVADFERARGEGKVDFPAFIKPLDGSSSINAYKVENAEDLRGYAEKIGGYVIQNFVSGKEYTVDIFCDLAGKPVYITPRERMEVRSGEVLKTKIAQDDRIIEEMQTLVADYKPRGQITVQLIRDEKTGEDYYIEINPRFGGGAPLSMKAGADSAEAVVRMLRGETLRYQPKAARNGAIYSRFDQSVCVDEGEKA